jgi:beta-ketodecanoyl-[acyl-carrier-protein] synthase
MAKAGGNPRVTGRAMYVPDDVLTNEDLAGVVDPERLAELVACNRWCQGRRALLAREGECGEALDGGGDGIDRRLYAEYIASRIGIRSRRVVDRASILAGRPSHRGVFGSDLGVEAARRALAAAGVAGGDLDLVICGTSTPDRIYPATAIEIQHRIGADRAYGFDLLAACTSFVYGIESARGLILAGLCRRALVVAAEYFSCGVDYRDPYNCYFWGDAAAAVVLESAELAAGKEGYEVVAGHHRSRLSEHIRTGLGGTRSFVAQSTNGDRPPREPVPGSPDYRYFYQEGPTVYHEVVPLVVQSARETVGRAGLGLDAVRLFLFHQASALMIDGIVRRLFRGRTVGDRVALNLERYGNTSSCGVGICLAEEAVMRPGDLACMTAFGAGYTVGSVLLRKVGPGAAA